MKDKKKQKFEVYAMPNPRVYVLKEEKAIRKNEYKAGNFVKLLNQEQDELQKALKRNQIEEMAKDLYGEIDYDVNYYSDDNYSEVNFDYKETAKNIVEKGWVKLPEDSVIISKERFKALETIEKYHIKSCGKDSVVLTMTEHAKLVSQVRDEFEHEYKDKVVLSREKYEKLKTQLKIKTNEADWRADQLQALDKDFELLEKVVKCKDCKWLKEKHYEEDNEKPYIKLVCKLTKRQCRLYDFCSYGESKV